MDSYSKTKGEGKSLVNGDLRNIVHRRFVPGMVKGFVLMVRSLAYLVGGKQWNEGTSLMSTGKM